MIVKCKKLKKALDEALDEQDEKVLHYIGKGIREKRYLSPQELFYIICWKAPSSYKARGKAANNAFKCIRKNGIEGIKAVTRRAIELSVEEDVEGSIEKLTELYGVRTRMASAILTFYNPKKFGCVDKQSWKALYSEDKVNFEPKDYKRYLDKIRKIAKECGLTPRQVDLALWNIGRKQRNRINR